MPGLSFTLPHWLYWVGLIVFPIIAMALSRRPRPEQQRYSTTLGYMILVAGGFLGLHRFYLKSLLGLVYIPLLLFVLFANGQERDARQAFSTASNALDAAQTTLEREQEQIESARQSLPRLREDLQNAEAGSFARTSAERRIERGERIIAQGEERISRARAEIEQMTPQAKTAQENRAYWNSAARYTFFVILALLAVDAILLPGMVRRANASLTADEKTPAEQALEAAEDAENPTRDAELVENWIDRLSLFCGEFVSYWAVIAVLVYYYEVIARYVFNSPTNWAHESMYLMFGMQYLISGAYAMLTESHVRVDVFYAPLPKKKKAWVDLLTSVFFFIFAGTLLVTSWIFAMDAIAVPTGNSIVSDWARGEIGFWQMLGSMNLAQWTDPAIRWGEISFNEWEVPLWPMKWVMVLGGLLLVLQGISKFSKDIREIARGN